MKNASGFYRIALVNIRSWIIKPTNGCCGDGSVFWKSSSGLSCYKGVAKSSSCVGHLRSHQFRIGSQASFLPMAPYVQRLNLHGSIKGSVIKERSLQCILFGCNYSHLHGKKHFELCFSCIGIVHNSWIPPWSVELPCCRLNLLDSDRNFVIRQLGNDRNTGLSVRIDFSHWSRDRQICSLGLRSNTTGGGDYRPRYWMLGKSHLLRKE